MSSIVAANGDAGSFTCSLFFSVESEPSQVVAVASLVVSQDADLAPGNASFWRVVLSVLAGCDLFLDAKLAA
jgi:hypothetical protein